jgi:hypothetical protein
VRADISCAAGHEYGLHLVSWRQYAAEPLVTPSS